jgi:hypothetical protein
MTVDIIPRTDGAIPQNPTPLYDGLAWPSKACRNLRNVRGHRWYHYQRVILGAKVIVGRT